MSDTPATDVRLEPVSDALTRLAEAAPSMLEALDAVWETVGPAFPVEWMPMMKKVQAARRAGHGYSADATLSEMFARGRRLRRKVKAENDKITQPPSGYNPTLR